MKTFIKTVMAGIFTSCMFWGSANASVNFEHSLEAQGDVMLEQIHNITESYLDVEAPTSGPQQDEADDLADRIEWLNQDIG